MLKAIPQMPLKLSSACHSLRENCMRKLEAQVLHKVNVLSGPNITQTGTARQCFLNLGHDVEKGWQFDRVRSRVTAGFKKSLLTSLKQGWKGQSHV